MALPLWSLLLSSSSGDQVAVASPAPSLDLNSERVEGVATPSALLRCLLRRPVRFRRLSFRSHLYTSSLSQAAAQLGTDVWSLFDTLAQRGETVSVSLEDWRDSGSSLSVQP